MNFTLKAGGRALILSPERPKLVGRSGQLIRKVDENWLMLVEGNRYAVSEKSLMPLDGFNPNVAASIELRKTA
ncbi:hypothetical protein FEM54_14230 [Pseudomonas edaphica]|uniref:KOW domain-containing protein n=1 Tax=Pseudomonas edaphica TaxID=2006980 RepID=A0ABY2U645_9PSED|nr:MULTISPECIES: hypothetical protein [Pseudomonas]NVZ70470.1 hypothetical protein [Pseudomonas costantinii]TLG91205.1 hypothetical protein FEM54_14230 [Pseudomonas edaphica]